MIRAEFITVMLTRRLRVSRALRLGSLIIQRIGALCTPRHQATSNRSRNQQTTSDTNHSIVRRESGIE
jgi:hypothetical protein